MERNDGLLKIVGDLVTRVTDHGKEVMPVLNTDMEDWADGALGALMESGVIRRARRATRIRCPGCERGCAMNVIRDAEVGANRVRNFIVCDQRDDIGIVPVEPALLAQWQISRRQIADFFERSTSMLPTTATSTPDDIALGRIVSKSGPNLVRVSFNDDAKLTIGNSSHPLCEVFIEHDGSLDLDHDLIQILADRADRPTDQLYQPSKAKREAGKQKTLDRNLDLQRRYRILKRNHPDWSDQSIAASFWVEMGKPERPKPETIRKQMTKRN